SAPWKASPSVDARLPYFHKSSNGLVGPHMRRSAPRHDETEIEECGQENIAYRARWQARGIWRPDRSLSRFVERATIHLGIFDEAATKLHYTFLAGSHRKTLSSATGRSAIRKARTQPSPTLPSAKDQYLSRDQEPCPANPASRDTLE